MGTLALRFNEIGQFWPIAEVPTRVDSLYLVNYSLFDLPIRDSLLLSGITAGVLAVSAQLREAGHVQSWENKGIKICIMQIKDDGISFISPDPESVEVLGNWFTSSLTSKNPLEPDAWYWLSIRQRGNLQKGLRRIFAEPPNGGRHG
jgi:hypothetical protein